MNYVTIRGAYLPPRPVFHIHTVDYPTVEFRKEQSPSGQLENLKLNLTFLNCFYLQVQLENQEARNI